MKLTAKRVNEILMDCLYRDEEMSDDGSAPDDAMVVEGIMRKFGLHPGRVQEHKSEIGEMLAELPDEFMAEHGGGMSFMQACMDRHGNHWAEHRSMDELFVLGMASGMVKCLMPRKMWSVLPGGMPYYVINQTSTD